MLGELERVTFALTAGRWAPHIEITVSPSRLRPRRHTTSYLVTETFAGAQCTMVGCALVAARLSARMRTRRERSVMERDVCV